MATPGRRLSLCFFFQEARLDSLGDGACSIGHGGVGLSAWCFWAVWPWAGTWTSLCSGFCVFSRGIIEPANNPLPWGSYTYAWKHLAAFDNQQPTAKLTSGSKWPESLALAVDFIQLCQLSRMWGRDLGNRVTECAVGKYFPVFKIFTFFSAVIKVAYAYCQISKIHKIEGRQGKLHTRKAVVMFCCFSTWSFPHVLFQNGHSFCTCNFQFGFLSLTPSVCIFLCDYKFWVTLLHLV